MRSSDLRDLKDFELLAAFDDSDREALAQEIVVREFEAGARLFERGDLADSLLFVAEGSVRIQREEGAESAELAAGSCMGALALIGDALRETRAETSKCTRVFELKRQAFDRLVASEPRTACHLLQGILRDQQSLLYEAAQALERDDS